MTHWDPRDTGDDEEDESRVPDILFLIGAVLWFVLCAALLVQCSEAKAAIPPFDVTLPTGQAIEACGMEYDARAKTLALAPCVVVFADSFEG